MKKNLRTTLLSLVAALGVGTALWFSSGTAADNGKGEAKPGKPAATVDIKPDTTRLPADLKAATSFASVVKKAAPSVVNIYTTKTIRGRSLDQNPFFDDPMFRRFFGDRFGGPGQRNAPRAFKERSLGSGVVVTADGYILTNDHVADGADEIKVTFEKDYNEYTAKVVGRDPKTDIAVLKIEGKNLPHVVLGDSDTLEVGDRVLAIGNPFGIGQTVTLGIISALSRGGMGIEDYEDFIQTDASINPGNSGGALVDVQGRLVGVNTAILSRSGGNQGVGFAVPINLVRQVMDQLIHTGKVIRGFLGISIQDVTPELAKQFNLPGGGGALVGGVTEGSAAAAAGIKSGDVIVEFAGKKVTDSRHLRLMVGHTAPGEKVPVQVLRDGKERTLTVTLKEMTDELQASRGSTPAPEGEEEALKGVGVSDLTAELRQQHKIPAGVKGALISDIDPNSAAYEAGLRVGDVIQEINRKPVSGAEDAVSATQNVKEKRTLLRVWSNGGSRYLVVDENKSR